MYAALFAAIGGAVDSEADTQQFMLPMTAPLILAMVLSQFIIQEPTGPVAFWFSIIPLTSPVVMMIRIPVRSSLLGSGALDGIAGTGIHCEPPGWRQRSTAPGS